MPHYLIALIVYAVIGLVAFAAYGIDKRKAKVGAWRTKEKTLLALGFCGGAVGALAGMNLFRHKTKHWYFWVVNVLGLSWQTLVFVYLLIN